jgi:MFS transporter, DHA2 family, methylenomycin A resistance protein
MDLGRQRYGNTPAVPGGAEAIPAEQAGLAGGLLNAGRQTVCALAVALYGALVSGSFLAGMRASILISPVFLAASSAAALVVLRAERG